MRSDTVPLYSPIATDSAVNLDIQITSLIEVNLILHHSDESYTSYSTLILA